MPDLLTIPRHGGDELRVSLNTFKGSEYLDLRIYFTADDGTQHPTKKGCTVPLWAVPDLQSALAAAMRKTSGPTTAAVMSLAAHRARMDQDAAVIDTDSAAP